MSASPELQDAISKAGQVTPLPETFRAGGFDFKLLKRDGMVALFEKTNGGRVLYEVVIIRQLPAQTIYGRTYPPREAMPLSEAWGSEGWSPCSLEEANQTYQRVSEMRKRN